MAENGIGENKEKNAWNGEGEKLRDFIEGGDWRGSAPGTMQGLKQNINSLIDISIEKTKHNDLKCPYCGGEKEFVELILFGQTRVVPLNCCEWEHEKENIWREIYRG